MEETVCVSGWWGQVLILDVFAFPLNYSANGQVWESHMRGNVLLRIPMGHRSLGDCPVPF